MSSDTSLPTLSIVVISFNTVDMTRECLASVYDNSDGLDIEIIVVDNNSADDSVNMIKHEFPSTSLIVNDDNKGFAAANNQGFKVAKGKYILLLNSDTVILDKVLIDSVSYMETNTNIGGLGCRILNTDMTMQRSCSGYPTLTRLLFLATGIDRIQMMGLFDNYLMRGWNRDSEKDVEVISGCYLLTKKSIINEIGGLDESFFFFGEETDWCLRVRNAGWKLRFSPIGEIIHHGGGSVKKMNYKRDVMLSNATVRLHKKNSGILAAAAAFFILSLFISTRTIYWSASALFSADSKERATYFRSVLREIWSIWPKDRV